MNKGLKIPSPLSLTDGHKAPRRGSSDSALRSKGRSRSVMIKLQGPKHSPVIPPDHE